MAEAAKRRDTDLSLVSIDSTAARAHHDAAGMHLGEDVLTALEKAATETEEPGQKEAASKNMTERHRVCARAGGTSGVAENSG
ncbi:hypothetical protein HC362_33015 [Streptomyces sp. 891-h]|nr:hypothetical protein HC362_33015 [Streptomyces sp. 891-h]